MVSVSNLSYLFSTLSRTANAANERPKLVPNAEIISDFSSWCKSVFQTSEEI